MSSRRGAEGKPHKEELSFMYFPDNYRWSHGVLIGLNAAPWGGAEIGEVNRIGLRLKDHVGDDKAWFREWAREAETVEKAGREHLAAGRKATAAKMLFRAANYYHVGERFLQPKSEGLEAYRRGVDCFRDAARETVAPAHRARRDTVRRRDAARRSSCTPERASGRRKRAPAMVFFDGFDVTKEIQYFKGVPDLVARGIACLIVDGPGNGESVRFREPVPAPRHRELRHRRVRVARGAPGDRPEAHRRDGDQPGRLLRAARCGVRAALRVLHRLGRAVGLLADLEEPLRPRSTPAARPRSRCRGSICCGSSTWTPATRP